MISYLSQALRNWRSAPVVVNTFKTKKTDLERLQDEKHRQLAAELGKPWPPASVGRAL